MASSSNNATFQLTSTTNRQSRIADAVQVAPYLTHVIRHHGQVTLIPPENSGRIRKTKKKRPALREENSSSSLDLLRPPSSRSRTHTLRPDPSNSVQHHRYEVDVRSVDVPSAGSGNESRDEMTIPSFPPPTFEEAMLATPSPMESITSPLADVRPSVINFLVDRDIPPELTSPPPAPGAHGSSSPPAETPASEPDSPHFSFDYIRDGHSQWEEDREAGFSLEERVRRELERRQLSNSLPQATSLSGTRRNSTPVVERDMQIGDDTSRCVIDEPEYLPAPQPDIDIRSDLSLSYGSNNQVSGHTEVLMALNLQSGISQSTAAANSPGTSINKGKERDIPLEPPPNNLSSSLTPNITPEGSAMSKIKELLNAPLRLQSSLPINSGNPTSMQTSPPSRSHEQPSIIYESSTSHSVSSSNDSSTLTSVSTDPVLPLDSSHTKTTFDIHPHTPQPAISNSSTPTFSQSTYVLPTPSSDLSSPPEIFFSIPRPSPLPPSGRSVRDRISAYESLQSRPVPPPPPFRPVIRRPPPPIPVITSVVERQRLFESREEQGKVYIAGHHTIENAPLLSPRRRAPPPLPPRRSHPPIHRDIEPEEITTLIQAELAVTANPSASTNTLITSPACGSTENDIVGSTVSSNGVIFGDLEQVEPNSVDNIGRRSMSLTLDVTHIPEDPEQVQHSAVGESTTTLVDSSLPPRAGPIVGENLAASVPESGVMGRSQAADEPGERDPRTAATSQTLQPHGTSEERNPESAITYQDVLLSNLDSPLDSSLSPSTSEHNGGSDDSASRQVPEPGLLDAIQLQPLQPMFTGPTELDLLLARLDDPDFTFSGQSYDDLLLLEEIMGPAPLTTIGHRTRFEDVSLGNVEVLRRRVTKDGRTKLKLALLGVVVDKCGICLVQFKEGVHACLPPCHHAFHDTCLRLWMRRSDTCPMCRGQLCA